jgi:hypothetical protein
MKSTSIHCVSNTAMTALIRRRAWAGRCAGMLLAVGSCAAFLAIVSTAAQAQQNGGAGVLRAAAAPTPSPAASAFCKHFSLSKVSSIVGAKVTLFEAVVSNNTLECIYFGTSISASRPEVIISMQPKIPAAEVATRAAAEARIAAESPKGVKVLFTSLASVGPTAFSWTYAGALNGGQIVGVADNKGTTAYGAAVGGQAKTFGAAAGHVPALERLLALDMAA